MSNLMSNFVFHVDWKKGFSWLTWSAFILCGFYSSSKQFIRFITWLLFRFVFIYLSRVSISWSCNIEDPSYHGHCSALYFCISLRISCNYYMFSSAREKEISIILNVSRACIAHSRSYTSVPFGQTFTWMPYTNSRPRSIFMPLSLIKTANCLKQTKENGNKLNCKLNLILKEH